MVGGVHVKGNAFTFGTQCKISWFWSEALGIRSAKEDEELIGSASTPGYANVSLLF